MQSNALMNLDINLDIVSLGNLLLGVLPPPKDIIKDIVSLEPVVLKARRIGRENIYINEKLVEFISVP